MRVAGHAESRQASRVDPGSEHALGRGGQAGWRFVLGIQVRTFDSRTPPRVVDQGQTIVELISTGT